jgi:hypothetical protein
MRMLWWTLLFPLAALAGCRADADAGRPSHNAAVLTRDWFDEEARTAGLNFVHANGMSGRFYFHEMMGPGAAVLDYDNDGDLDVLLVQGQGASKLYRNDLVIGADGSRTLAFTDVTAASGITTTGYGMGVATGDFDNDGCVDVYLTNFGSNQFYRNNCDGTFTDVTMRTGTGGSGWSVSAAFVDYDRDGWLDLFVGHYVSYSVAHNTPCFSLSGRPDYCSPNAYRPEQNRLYHNNRDGTFTDVTARAGLAGDFGPTLGVVADDVDGDGWIDLYVANDGRENQLWINQHDGTFRNEGLLSGTALTADTRAPGSMGVDAADLDANGQDDLVVTTLAGEGLSLFANRGSRIFDDAGARAGIRTATLRSTGFGLHAVDVDNDGWLDLISVNGAVRTIEALAQRGDPFPLHERKLLLRNIGGGRFEDASEHGGAAFALSDVGRGAAFGDIDNDGDIDVVVANNNGPARLLVNVVGNRHHWVGLRLRGRNGRDMVGARVQVGTQWRRAATDGSYASANDPRVLVGRGDSAAPPPVKVVWPDGRVERWPSVPVDRYTTLEEGTGL